MSVLQSNAAPVTSGDSLQIVTLKNLVALDLVEQNENLLRSFGLLDDSRTKAKIRQPLTNDQLQKLIKERQVVLDPSEELKQYKAELLASRDLKSKQLLESLAAEFLNDEIPHDNTDELIRQFEIENGVKVIIDDSDPLYYRVDGTSLKETAKTETKVIGSQEETQEEDQQQEL